MVSSRCNYLPVAGSHNREIGSEGIDPGEHWIVHKDPAILKAGQARSTVTSTYVRISTSICITAFQFQRRHITHRHFSRNHACALKLSTKGRATFFRFVRESTECAFRALQVIHVPAWNVDFASDIGGILFTNLITCPVCITKPIPICRQRTQLTSLRVRCLCTK